MTRVDFYVLEHGDGHAHDRMICRVVEKAFLLGHAVFVECGDERRARSIDDLLWRLSDTSFIPHGFAGDGAPVTLGYQVEQIEQCDVLVNLNAAVPKAVSQFERVVESAGYDTQSRAVARERYRYYQERGFPLNTHKIRP